MCYTHLVNGGTHVCLIFLADLRVYIINHVIVTLKCVVRQLRVTPAL